jgi:hypothetical protein
MRRVLHVPILHSAADLGSLSESVRTEYTRALGPAGWSRHQEAVELLWRTIRERIEALDLDYARTRIYQDGLPVCGFERKIVEELAKAGSSNHQLVADLLEKGAVLEGTEDPQLLVREYHLQQRISQGVRNLARKEDLATGKGGSARTAPDTMSPSDAEARAVLLARDRFVADRIVNTLQEGETALVFLGAAHRLDALGQSGIRMETI